jgi:hypothetical protein
MLTRSISYCAQAFPAFPTTHGEYFALTGITLFCCFDIRRNFSCAEESLVGYRVSGGLKFRIRLLIRRCLCAQVERTKTMVLEEIMSYITCFNWWQFSQRTPVGRTLSRLLRVPLVVVASSVIERLGFTQFRMLQPALARPKNRAIK